MSTGILLISGELVPELMQKTFESRATDELHRLAVSMASFIAEIDRNSADVAAYIEQRLAPLAEHMRRDQRVADAVALMVSDARKLVQS